MNIPAIMLNQWPDEFYHTNMDTIDKVDVELTKRIAAAVGTAAYLFASFNSFNELKTYIYHYYASLLHRELSNSYDNPKIYKLRISYLCNSLANYLESITPELVKNIKSLCKSEENSCHEKEPRYKIKLIGIFSLRSIYKLDKELALKIQRLMEREPWLRTAVTLIQSALNAPKSKSEVKEFVDTVLGREVSREFIDMIFRALELIGAIEKEH